MGLETASHLADLDISAPFQRAAARAEADGAGTCRAAMPAPAGAPPSIETMVHASPSGAAVPHIHSVASAGGVAATNELDGLKASLDPHARIGRPPTRGIMARALGPPVIALADHGPIATWGRVGRAGLADRDSEVRRPAPARGAA